MILWKEEKITDSYLGETTAQLKACIKTLTSALEEVVPKSRLTEELMKAHQKAGTRLGTSFQAVELEGAK